MKYYLAYGSNLNKAQMAVRCPDAVPFGVSKIDDYELVFRRGYLTIEPKKGAHVPVGLWAISDEDEKALDRYEGFPKFYYKKNFTVDHFGPLEAMAYIMVDGHPIQKPSTLYIRTVDHGYRDFGFSNEDWELLFKANMRARGM